MSHAMLSFKISHYILSVSVYENLKRMQNLETVKSQTLYAIYKQGLFATPYLSCTLMLECLYSVLWYVQTLQSLKHYLP